MENKEMHKRLLMALKIKLIGDLKQIDEALECMSKEQETKELTVRRSNGFTMPQKQPNYNSFKYEQAAKDAKLEQNKQLFLLNFQAEHDCNEKNRAWDGDTKHWFIINSTLNNELEIDMFTVKQILNVVYFSTRQLAEAALHAYKQQFITNRNEK
jgi:hypothetical protein